MKSMMLDDKARDAILGQMGEGVIVADASGKIVFINDLAKSMHGIGALGVGPDAWVEQYNLYAQDGSKIDTNDLPLARAVQRAETITDFRWLIRHPDGREVLAIGSARPVYGEDGGQLGSVLTLRDDSQRFALEQKLKQLNENLEARVEAAVAEARKSEAEVRNMQRLDALGKLTGGIAHEINNVLTVVISTLEEIEQTHSDNPDTRVAANNALNASERVAEMVNYLLSYARRLPLDPRAVAVREAFDAIEQTVRAVDRQDVIVKLSHCDGVQHIFADFDQLRAILANLVLNAMEAMPNGGTLKVSAKTVNIDDCNSTLGQGDYIALELSDTGKGMSPDVLDRAIEPFFTTHPAGQARGIGLSAVDGFARQSGGSLHISSQLGSGTAAILTLPACSHDRPAMAVQVLEKGGHAARVLLVDDDPDVLRSTARLLERLDFRVTVADGAASALRQLEEDEDFDLVLSDVMMQGRPDGLDLARDISSRYPAMPILLTSGYVDSVRGSLTDFNVDFLSKPYRREQLLSKIKGLLTNL